MMAGAKTEVKLIAFTAVTCWGAMATTAETPVAPHPTPAVPSPHQWISSAECPSSRDTGSACR